MVTIMLDAGHYGRRNQSPVVPEYYESEVMWELHLLLKEFLIQRGFAVLTTREDKDKDLEVTKRGRAARGCDLFLSLHSNAASVEYVDRVCGIHQAINHQTPETKAVTERSRALAELLADTVSVVMDTKDNPKVYQRLSGIDRDGDGAVNDNYYGVLHGSFMAGVPGVILENSFHTNKRSAKWLLDKDNLTLLTLSIAKALSDSFGVLPTKGDINRDGVIDAKDYLLAKRIFFGTYTPDPAEFYCADFDGDGVVTASDCMRIKRKAQETRGISDTEVNPKGIGSDRGV